MNYYSLHFTHYFRAQFDLTEINFTINGYEYHVFDDYDGEKNRPKAH